jgi:hypothetical protein
MADDKTSTKRIWFCQGWARVAEAYGDLTEEVLTEALAESRVRSWDDTGSPIEPEFYRLNLEINPARNSARERTYTMMVLDSDVPVTESSDPSHEHHGITLAHADVLALLRVPPLAGKEVPGEGPQLSRTRQALKKRYPPDGCAPGIATKAVRKLIVEDLADDSKKRGLADPSWDTVKRALGRDK